MVIPVCDHDVGRLVSKIVYSGGMDGTFRVAVHHFTSHGQYYKKFHMFSVHDIMVIPVCDHDVQRLVSKKFYSGGMNGTVRVAVHYLASCVQD